MEMQIQMPFNTAQVEILKLFSQGLTNEQTEELRQLLITFKFSLLDKQVEKAAKQKNLSEQQINQASFEHRRTAYRLKKSEGDQNVENS